VAAVLFGSRVRMMEKAQRLGHRVETYKDTQRCYYFGALLSRRDALSEAANEALALHEQLVGQETPIR